MTFSNPGLKAPPTIFRVESNDSDIVRCTGVDGHTHYARLASSFTWQHSERLETCVLLIWSLALMNAHIHSDDVRFDGPGDICPALCPSSEWQYEVHELRL